MNGWKIASSYIVGRGHISKKIPCQDRTFKLVHKHSTGIFYGFALADGAGSCKFSDIGAEFIVNKILDFLKSKFSFILKKKNPSRYITKYIEEEIRVFSNKKNIDFKELSSTLLFVAIKNDKFIIGHIGDGVIGALDNNGILKTISKPENGEFSNSTFFTTSIKHKERLRLLKGTLKNSVGFILMSDGSEESLYDKKNKTLGDINKSIINWLEDNSEKDVEDALYDNLEQLISKKTYDDCSIGILRKIISKEKRIIHNKIKSIDALRHE